MNDDTQTTTADEHEADWQSLIDQEPEPSSDDEPVGDWETFETFFHR